MAKKLYVGNLSYDTTEDSLKEAFSQAGEVASVFIPKDKFSNRPKGFGFVEFANDEDAPKGIEMFNGKELDGRTLKVDEARPPVARDGNDRRDFQAAA